MFDLDAVQVVAEFDAPGEVFRGERLPVVTAARRERRDGVG